MMRSLRCSVSILLLWQALTIIRSGASQPPWRYLSMHYEDPDFFGEYQCSELAEIKDDIRALKSLVEGLRQKLDPDFKPAVTEDAVRCPEGFQYLSEASGCYKVIMGKHTWSSAMEQCQSLNPNTHLISIESQEENEAVTKYLKKQVENRRANYRCRCTWDPSGCTAFWTSGQRANISDCSSEFVWKRTAEGEVPFNYTHWNKEEPNCWGGGETCAEIFLNTQSFWNDVSCDTGQCSICEYALKPEASTENPEPLAEQTEAPEEESSGA